MKLPVLKRLDKQDLAGKGDIPSWVDGLLQALNTFLDPVGKCLQRRITFSDQFFGVQMSVSLTHGVKTTINPVIQAQYAVNQMRVVAIQLVDPDGQIVTGFGWTRNANGTIGVTANFAAGGTTTATCVLQVQFG